MLIMGELINLNQHIFAHVIIIGTQTRFSYPHNPTVHNCQIEASYRTLVARSIQRDLVVALSTALSMCKCITSKCVRQNGGGDKFAARFEEKSLKLLFLFWSGCCCCRLWCRFFSPNILFQRTIKSLLEQKKTQTKVHTITKYTMHNSGFHVSALL